MPDIRLLLPAQRELDEAFDYYEEQRNGLGREFLEEVLSALKRIKLNPTAWAPFSNRTFRCVTKRFPYGIIYQVRDEMVLVIAIAHQHRKPDYWKDRIG